jgi:hypothetical protein
MCFSAGASFTAGAMLTLVGTETYRKVHKPAQLVLASIPVFFALQQFSEGVVWLTIGQAHHAVLLAVFSNIFLVFAVAVWPIMVPLSVLFLEENKKRKKIITWLLALGAAVAAYYLFGLIFHNNVRAQVMGMHVVYQHGAADLPGLIAVSFYLVAALTPLFVSTIKRVYLIGIVMGVAFIVSAIFYFAALTSVWCFFAAIISFIVFYIVDNAHKLFHIKGIEGIKN